MFNSLTRVLSGAVAASIAVASLGIATASPASAAASWQWLQMDSDACWDAASMDADYNGYPEQIWFDLDNDCRLDTRMFNTVGHDSFLEWVSFDMNEDSRPEMWIEDTNQRSGYEWVHFDNNRDGRFDLTRSMTTVATSPTYSGQANLLLAIARINGTVAYGR